MTKYTLHKRPKKREGYYSHVEYVAGFQGNKRPYYTRDAKQARFFTRQEAEQERMNWSQIKHQNEQPLHIWESLK